MKRSFITMLAGQADRQTDSRQTEETLTDKRTDKHMVVVFFFSLSGSFPAGGSFSSFSSLGCMAMSKDRGGLDGCWTNEQTDGRAGGSKVHFYRQMSRAETHIGTHIHTYTQIGRQIHRRDGVSKHGVLNLTLNEQQKLFFC